MKRIVKQKETGQHDDKIRFGLKAKLLLSMVGLVALAGILIMSVLMVRSVAFNEEQARNDTDNDLAAFELLIESEKNALQAMYKMLQNYPGLREAIADGDRDAVKKILRPVFRNLEEDFGITTLQINDASLHAFYRAHEPDEYGDDLSFRPLLRNVYESNQPRNEFDMGSSGLAIRAAGPINNEYGMVIAVLELGKTLNDEFLDQLKERLDVDMTIFAGNERIATTIATPEGERAVGTTIEHEEILHNVLAEGGRWSGRQVISGNNNIIGAYTAIRDIDGEVTGMLFAGQPSAEFDARRNQDLLLALVLLIACLAASAMVAVLLSSKIVGPVISLSRQFKKVATGDFTVEIRDYGKDEIGVIGRAVKGMLADLRSLLAKTVESARLVEQLADGVAGASDNISLSIQDVASSVNEVAASTSQLSSSSQDMTGESMRVAEKAGHGEKEIHKALDQMKAIEGSFSELKTTIGRLGERSANIGEIVKVINEISEQTNLLALNAAIEAARAGEYGRGFAVVADEVRKLAEQSSESTKEIERLITETQKDANNAVSGMEKSAAAVDEGITIMSYSSETFGQILGAIENLLGKIQDVASASEELSASSQEVAASTEEQSASIEEITAAAEDLKQSAANLYEELKRFTY
ncbi:MAG: methyl-accepting chemotaxis protein [Bacillota bacterium]|nr:methyl-accepting chemotaxis protein [Bacillota bacterium]MDW7682969.1 methyl-accepting chemotaxis protein [Bacillota bacterium]